MTIGSTDKAITRLLAMLLILLAEASFAVPAGLHIELCYDKAGRLDISLDSCTGVSPPQGQTENGCKIGHGHHDECRDLVLACAASKEYLAPDAKSRLAKIKTLQDAPPDPGVFAGKTSPRRPYSADWSPVRLARQPSTPSHLVSLRTVVLII